MTSPKHLSSACPLTAIVLMFAFGTMSAIVMPLLVGFAVVGISVGVMNLISRGGGVPLDESFAQVILLVGLAAAIDYGIYMIGRYRHERKNGYPETAAVVGATGTVGKAVLISALTTLLALSGLFFLSSATFTSLALGGDRRDHCGADDGPHADASLDRPRGRWS